MKKMNFEQMEVIHGGQTVMTAAASPIANDDFKVRCISEGLYLAAAGLAFACALGGTTATAGVISPTVAIASLTVLAASSGFMDCYNKR